MSRYILAPEASLDLEEIYDYLASFDINAADRFLDSFIEKCDRVSEFPNMGKSYDNLAPRLRGFFGG